MALPRTRLARTPTPLEPLPRLSAAIGGAEIWLKRDDETGLALGGNKIRQLEYYFGAAQAEGADTVLITGARQSNFVRSTAAAAAKLGMACHVQLEDRVANEDDAYRTSGNVLLDRLFGATIHTYGDGEDEAGADAQLSAIAADLRGEGRRPYIIPLSPGHPPLGALGYVDCANEILEQLRDAEAPAFDEILVASGSGSTHGGLLYGLRAAGNSTPLRGMCVRRSADQQGPRIADRCSGIAALLGQANPVAADDVQVDDSQLAPGYGQLNAAMRDAIHKTATLEGILLDPVYTGKVMAGTLVRAAAPGPNQKILMIHTGGTPALFAYPDLLEPA